MEQSEEEIQDDCHFFYSRPANNKFTPSSSGALCLNRVQSLDVLVEIPIGNGWTNIELKNVPIFLIRAFEDINKRGLCVDGIFRKDGNSARLNRPEVQSIFRGIIEIPTEYTVIDVCTLIKRFLREMKPSLINSEDVRNKLLDRARRAKVSGNYKLTREEMSKIFFDSNPGLPDLHFSMLGYIMRQLKKISLHSDKHKMSVENLALVLVCSIFGEEKKLGMPYKNKKFSQDQLLANKKHYMDILVAAVKLLIINASYIGLLKDTYISSCRSRSRSSYTSTRSSSFNVESLDGCGALKTHYSLSIDNLKTKKEKQRSVSVANRFIPIFRGKQQDAASSKRKMKEPLPPQKVEKENLTMVASTSAVRQSRSVQAKRTNTNASLNKSDGEREDSSKEMGSFRNAIENTKKRSLPLRGKSASEQNSDALKAIDAQHEPGEQINAYEFLKEYCQSPRAPTMSEPIELLKRTSVSKKRSSRNRRHTAPVNNGIRRNRPNTVGAGLPIRRATLIVSSSEDKENHNSDTEGSANESLFGLDSSEAILEQKANEARMRRIHRKHRIRHPPSTESMVVLNGSMGNAESAASFGINDDSGSMTSEKMNTLKEEESNTDKNEIMQFSDTDSSIPTSSGTDTKEFVSEKVDAASSPIVIDSNAFTSKTVLNDGCMQDRENGHVWIGKPQIVSESVEPFEYDVPVRPGRPSRLYSKGRDTSTDIPPRTCLSPIMKHIAQNNNSPPANVYTTTIASSSSSKTTSRGHFTSSYYVERKSFDPQSIPPPLPKLSPPKLDKERTRLSLGTTRPPTPPLNPHYTDPFTPRLPKRGEPTETVNRSMSVKPLSYSYRDRNAFGVTSSVLQDATSSSSPSMESSKDDSLDFGGYSDFVQSKLLTSDDMLGNNRSNVARPSVAVILNKNSGFVRSRINQFQGIEKLSKSNGFGNRIGRTSALSQISSGSNETPSSSRRSSDAFNK